MARPLRLQWIEEVELNDIRQRIEGLNASRYGERGEGLKGAMHCTLHAVPDLLDVDLSHKPPSPGAIVYFAEFTLRPGDCQ